MPPLTAHRLLCLAALLSAACSGPNGTAGGQTGAEEPPATCDWLNEPKVALERQAVSALGFSADQVLASIMQLQDIPFKYQHGGETRLALTPSYVGPTQYGKTCKDLQLGMSVRFTTVDGVFDETLPLTFRATRVDRAGGTLYLQQALIHGHFQPSEPSTTRLGFGMSYDGGKATGYVDELAPNSTGGELSSLFASF